jgi:hypothetical protein
MHATAVLSLVLTSNTQQCLGQVNNEQFASGLEKYPTSSIGVLSVLGTKK